MAVPFISSWTSYSSHRPSEYFLFAMSTHNSVVTRVLDIPEILELIFSYLDEDSNRLNLTVCKKWSEIAMNALWRDVCPPYRLFSLLAPLQRKIRSYETQDFWVRSQL